MGKDICTKCEDLSLTLSPGVVRSADSHSCGPNATCSGQHVQAHGEKQSREAAA